MKGYWRKPGQSAEVLPGGWLRTGDGGSFAADGFLYLHDRLKDMIVSGGENVYPAEVESVMTGHPDVAEVAVVGIPSDEWGESPYAVVVLRPGARRDPVRRLPGPHRLRQAPETGHPRQSQLRRCPVASASPRGWLQIYRPKHRTYQNHEIDYFGMYCPDTALCTWCRSKTLALTPAYLRIQPAKNNQAKGVRWAMDYEGITKSE